MSATTDTYVLLRAFVDELARCGMRVACTSPGSRCAPLVLTLAREPHIACYSHIDERCAGFFALGAAKASGLPVAVTCTSGTAAAELLPAAIEAHEARVPLLLLTADRPPELRENGAGQAIDQLKLYGSAAKWFFEVGALDGADPARLRWIRTLACRAYWTALEGRPGAVHLNFPLREPLVTDEPLPDDTTARPDGQPYVRRGGHPIVCPEAAVAPDRTLVSRGPVPIDPANPTGSLAEPGGRSGANAVAILAARVSQAARGVLIAGRHERVTPLGEAAARFCEAAGWPLLADPMSGARRGAAAVAHYDALLRDETFSGSHRPDLVLRVGDLPVSKPLRTWLAGLTDVPQIALDPESAWQDPAAVLSESLTVEPTAALISASPPPPSPPSSPSPPSPPSSPSPHSSPSSSADPNWLERWRRADELAAEAIRTELSAAEKICEPAVALELGVLLPEEATLFVASSMPVRDIETVWPARDGPPRVLCNRGANGIDGTVSSAFGAAASRAAGDYGGVNTGSRDGGGGGSGGPVVLLIGDVALAHDIGGLLAARRLDLRLTIVLVDNGGGGIFDFLPVAHTSTAAERDVYTRHIATPTGLRFERVAELYGLAYERVESIPALRTAFEQALAPRAGSTLVHVQADRAENVALHGRMWNAVSQALASQDEGAVRIE